MRIGLDVDGVVAATPSMIIKNIILQDPLCLFRCIFNPFNMSGKNEHIFNVEFFSSLRPYKNAVSHIKALAEYNEIVFITARNEEVKECTYKWLYDLFGDKFSLYLSRSKEKWRLIDRLGIDYYLDDMPAIVHDIRNNTRCEAFILRRPWNYKNWLDRYCISWDDFYRKCLFSGSREACHIGF